MRHSAELYYFTNRRRLADWKSGLLRAAAGWLFLAAVGILFGLLVVRWIFE